MSHSDPVQIGRLRRFTRRRLAQWSLGEHFNIKSHAFVIKLKLYNAMQDLAEVKVTLMPDGGTELVDGPPPGDNDVCETIAHRPARLLLMSSSRCETKKKFGSADCVVDTSGAASRTSSPPPMLPRRARRSLPCRAASVNDYTAELQLQHNRFLVRRQSQPEYVGVAR